MIIIGEKLNSSIPSAKTIIENKDTAAVTELAKKQVASGAAYVDINAGMFLEKEPEYLSFLAETVGEKCGLPLSVDTPSVEAARVALRKAGDPSKCLINSVTVEKGRLEGMTALAREYGCSVVALCMPESGAGDSETVLKTADSLITYLTANGIKEEGIFIDPMLKPVGAEEGAGMQALDLIRRLRGLYPVCHISCGLSNLSFGLPKRRLLNRAFAVAAVTAGLDAAIADPLDHDLISLVSAAEAISGRDEYCMEYIGKCRSGEIG